MAGDHLDSFVRMLHEPCEPGSFRDQSIRELCSRPLGGLDDRQLQKLGWHYFSVGKRDEGTDAYRVLASRAGAIDRLMASYLGKLDRSDDRPSNLGMVCLAAGDLSRAKWCNDCLFAHRRFLECEYAGAGTVNWLIGDVAGAIRTWKAGLQSEGIGAELGVRLLLYYAAVTQPSLLHPQRVREMVRSRIRDPRAITWPGPLGRLVLGEATPAQVLRDAPAEFYEVAAVAPAMVRFYTAVVEYSNGNMNRYLRLLREAGQVFALRFYEGYIARYELDRAVAGEPGKLGAGAPAPESTLGDAAAFDLGRPAQPPPIEERGGSYVNIALRGPGQERVAKKLAGLGRQAIVSAAAGKCTVVYEAELDGQDVEAGSELAARLSRTLRAVALYVLVHDDDVLLYRLYRTGKLLDEYNSSPGYFDFADPPPGGTPRGPAGGDAGVLCEAFGCEEAAAKVRAVLRRKYPFETRRHRKLAQLLGLPECAVGLGYVNVASDVELPEGFVSTGRG